MISAKEDKAMFSSLSIPKAEGGGKESYPRCESMQFPPAYPPRRSSSISEVPRNSPEKEQKPNLIMMLLQAALKSQWKKTELNLL